MLINGKKRLIWLNSNIVFGYFCVQTTYIRIQLNEIYNTIPLLSWKNVFHFLTDPEPDTWFFFRYKWVRRYELLNALLHFLI